MVVEPERRPGLEGDVRRGPGRIIEPGGGKSLGVGRAALHRLPAEVADGLGDEECCVGRDVLRAGVGPAVEPVVVLAAEGLVGAEPAPGVAAMVSGGDRGLRDRLLPRLRARVEIRPASFRQIAAQLREIGRELPGGFGKPYALARGAGAGLVRGLGD